ncbi:MAG: hypothetical protein HYZ27_08385 [Deltaproteobacteria bacterium]|nr:hypothetical protein [Deltaproteobacteria bacterium]
MTRCVLLLACAACTGSRPVALHGAAPAPAADDYDDVLAAWTRSDKVYQGLDNKLFVTATYHAPELRRAFAVAFPDIYGHGGTITRRELVDLTEDIERYHNFFIAMYTPDPKWNDLAKPDSIWRLTLVGSGEVAVGPHEVVPIKVDENLRAVYPYIHRFDKCYLVRFPLADPMRNLVIQGSTTGFTLRIASALGVGEMVWRLVPGA